MENCEKQNYCSAINLKDIFPRFVANDIEIEKKIEWEMNEEIGCGIV
jgi:hypothetical protein